MDRRRGSVSWASSRGAFGRDDFLRMLDVVESYVFRRAVCDLPSHGLNRYFPSLVARLDKLQDEGGNYVEAFIAYLLNEAGTPRRFPTDAEFWNALRTRDSYGFNKSLHMLSRLENSYHEKDERDFATGSTIGAPRARSLSTPWAIRPGACKTRGLMLTLV